MPALLMPERAAFLPASRTLLVADLHLGKGQALRALGGPVPQSVNARLLDEHLDRLERAAQRTAARRLLILGDLLHAASGLDAPLIDAVAERTRAWRDQLDLAIDLIPGNHDRALHRIADAWSIRILPECAVEPPFAFTHAPPRDAAPASFVWCGHLHPAVILRRRGDALKLPCFHLGSSLGVLPAFSSFTAGAPLPREPSDRVFAVSAAAVFQA